MYWWEKTSSQKYIILIEEIKYQITCNKTNYLQFIHQTKPWRKTEWEKTFWRARPGLRPNYFWPYRLSNNDVTPLIRRDQGFVILFTKKRYNWGRFKNIKYTCPFYTLDQWFPTRVPRNTRVPWGGARVAAKYWNNILYCCI